MARLSNQARRAQVWVATQAPRPTPHIVRLGRAANDNYRRPSPLQATVAGLVMVALLTAAFLWLG